MQTKSQQIEIPPTIFTIFGITGDLAGKKLIPALYNLKKRGFLPREWYLVGYARRDWTDEFLRNYIRDIIKMNVKDFNGRRDGKTLDQFVKNVSYVQGDFEAPADYQKLAGFLDRIEARSRKHINKLFYLATAPVYYPEIFGQLGKCGLSHCTSEERSSILIEKPFGRDEQSAAKLNKILLKHFNEDQIYRIDHYLGKEPVQNILSFRFGNGLFEHLWSNKHIDNIQISAAMEDIGIETRGRFYEQTGALLDVAQNHVLQLLALVCMDEPYSLDAEHIRDQKLEVLKKVHIDLAAKNIVKGQYAKGTVKGKIATGYRGEENVSPRSKVETFVAMRMQVSDPRWSGVPIYVRTGKRVAKRYTDINIEFKQPHVHFLGDTRHELMANVLSLRIQPDESISLRLMVKRPDFDLELAPAQMDFQYSEHFPMQTPDAYERIVFDALRNDQTLFVRSDSVIQQWRIIDRIKKNWNKYPLEFYKAGTPGPKGQDALLKRDGHNWWS